MRRGIKKVGTVVVAVLTAVVLLNINNFALATVPGTNQRVSLTSTGTEINGAYGSGNGFVSANGRMATFYSSAPYILPTGGPGIFIKDLNTGSIERLNMSTAGVVGNDNAYTAVERISATGRYVIFRSAATNLIDGVPISASPTNLYLRDVVASTTTLINQSSSGSTANGWTQSLGVSSDGRFVSFTSNASNLHPDATDGTPHLYMLDRTSNNLSILDRRPDGTIPAGNPTWPPVGAMSCDGSLIAFQYAGSNGLIPGDTSSQVNVYLLDRRGDVDKISNLTGSANSFANAPSISCNGDFVGMRTRATNLDSSISMTPGINTYRPFIYDRVNGKFHLAAITTANTAIDYSDVCNVVTAASNPCIEISDKGVGVFAVNYPSLTGASGRQVYLRDINSGTTELVSKSSTGVAGNDSSNGPTISADGKIILYGSNASNLVTGDTNGRGDVFTSLTGY